MSNKNTREQWPRKDKTPPAPFGVMDVVTSEKTGMTGTVRAMYAKDSPEWLMDVEISDGHIYYGAKCALWKLAAKADE